MSTPAEGMEVETPKLDLNILNSVKDAQNRNGLRHSDFVRYRQYCTRRLRRLHSTLKFKQGKGRFQKRLIDPTTVTDERYLLLVLTRAERCWSYAMELKDEDRSAAPRRHQHMLRRLRKATMYSKQLATLCHAVATDRTTLEAEAYSSWMCGNEFSERSQWHAACEQYLRAKTIYDELCKVGDASQRRVWMQRVDEIETSVRYCKYNLERTKTKGPQLTSTTSTGDDDLLKSKLNTVLSEAKKQPQAEALKWRGREVVIEDEKVRASIMRAREQNAEASKESNDEKKQALFDQALMAFNDALKKVEADLHAIGTTSSAGGSKKVEEAARALTTVRGFLIETRTTLTLDRNIAITKQLVAQLKRGKEEKVKGKKLTTPVDVAKMFDTLLKDVDALTRVLEECQIALSDAESAVLEARAVTFQTFRAFYAADAFSRDSRWPEAWGLYTRASALIQIALRKWAAIKSAEAKDEIASLKEIESTIESGKCVSHAHAVVAQTEAQNMDVDASLSKPLQDASLTDKIVEPVPLVHRLHEYRDSVDEKHPLADFPPGFVPMPCKPYLFDLASNHIAFPDLAHKAAQKRGWFGGWFGGR
eukprot:TRINITY_DN182_c0_g1::TRINITY_DN182_c0_g1_i1::g.14365::m.14365 TRINITY_DN182_c0_g1::TRINITY_DN182_c0_g1_i1::g.14365  ORF type:complete len:603 (-),score=178.26,sp/Q00004/SRP68_CANLF/32.83/5e-86 TRINITY_DN182_c0_g1_i1:57-1829(-)